jgi:hypothetical protein
VCTVDLGVYANDKSRFIVGRFHLSIFEGFLTDRFKYDQTLTAIRKGRKFLPKRSRTTSFWKAPL